MLCGELQPCQMLQKFRPDPKLKHHKQAVQTLNAQIGSVEKLFLDKTQSFHNKQAKVYGAIRRFHIKRQEV